jgi:hypothetical protein
MKWYMLSLMKEKEGPFDGDATVGQNDVLGLDE